jgi:type IV secretion system protein VirD4
MPTGILFGQIAVVLCVSLCGVWTATQWTAAALGFQAPLGSPWFEVLGIPVYPPWRLFEWWYFYDAYAPDIFLRGGAIAASSGMLAAGAAIAMAVWRSRLAKRATTYGSARWAEPEEIEKAGLTKPAGVFLGRLKTKEG